MQNYLPYFKAEHIVLIKRETYVCGQSKLNEVRYLFTIAISTHNHKERKQP